MASAKNAGKAKPQWVIDTHGVRESLTTSSNSLRTAIIDAIESGEMLILKGVSDEIKKLYPDLWGAFKAIERKTYLTITVSVVQTASALMEEFGSSLLGSVPSREHFEAVAAARMQGCKLVSSARAFANCKKIADKCLGIKSGAFVSLQDYEVHDL